jgi:hypothetical protein
MFQYFSCSNIYCFSLARPPCLPPCFLYYPGKKKTLKWWCDIRIHRGQYSFSKPPWGVGIAVFHPPRVEEPFTCAPAEPVIQERRRAGRWENLYGLLSMWESPRPSQQGIPEMVNRASWRKYSLWNKGNKKKKETCTCSEQIQPSYSWPQSDLQLTESMDAQPIDMTCWLYLTVCVCLYVYVCMCVCERESWCQSIAWTPYLNSILHSINIT